MMDDDRGNPERQDAVRRQHTSPSGAVPPRDASGTRALWIWLEQLFQDVYYGLRMLRRHPALTTVVILTFALGVGLNTAVFSVFNAVLVRPLDYPHPDRLVFIDTHGPDSPIDTEIVRGQDFEDWRAQATSFEHLVAYIAYDDTLSVGADAAQERIAWVSDDYWKLSGAGAVLGRLPEPGERGVIVVTHDFYHRQLHGDPTVIGRAVTLGNRKVSIIGVLRQGVRFQFPLPVWPGFEPKEIVAYRPAAVSPNELVLVAARLKPQVSAQAAQLELELIGQRRIQTQPDGPAQQPEPGTRVRVRPLHAHLLGRADLALRILLGAVVLVLLIACASITSLLLVRGSARQREMAIRVSVGAGRTRVLRQLLVETSLLALAGGAAGLLFAQWATQAVVRTFPHAMPRLAETAVDGRVLAFALSVSLTAAFLCGLAPAISIWRMNVQRTLTSGAGTSASAGALRSRQLLVAGQIAMAVVLLSSAALLTKSLWRMHAQPPGANPAHVLLMKVPMSGPRYRDPPARRAYAEEVLQRLQAVPGVQATSITTRGYLMTALTVHGAPPAPEKDVSEHFMLTATSAGFARVTGLQMVSGRWIADVEPEAAIVINQTLARREFPGQDPVGKRVHVSAIPDSEAPSFATIVGVAADLKYSRLDGDPEAEAFVPYTSVPDLPQFTALVRTASDPLPAAAALRGVLSQLDPTQPIYDVMTLEQALADSIAPRRFNLMLLGFFACVALLLALIGIYAVTASAVAQRTNEIGIRMALGASPAAILLMIVRQGVTIVLAGTLIGLGSALVLGGVVQNLLYEVTATDPLIHAAMVTSLALAALAACLIAARRAATMGPLRAMRME